WLTRVADRAKNNGEATEGRSHKNDRPNAG
ncbi:MAG: hypothetical protein K0Q64_1386, partial [Nitrobacter vulgaris]|nr:hypothetical protein [Nitrobacter vulgaris]